MILHLLALVGADGQVPVVLAMRTMQSEEGGNGG